MPTDELKSTWEVLVVDDEAGIRELMMAYFDSLGMTVSGAQDGRIAFEPLRLTFMGGPSIHFGNSMETAGLSCRNV